jgi:hypothetical protein
MDSTTFLLSSKSNSKIDGNQITFGTIDFQPHAPTLAPVFARLDHEMDLTIGSFAGAWLMAPEDSLCVVNDQPVGNPKRKV